ncbi:hypothetical protein SH139x_001093 [Planctomycetaceae bacterium SH139]
MPMTEVQKSKVAALRSEMKRLDPATYQDIRESYYQIADNLHPLVNALEKADADLGLDGPLLEEHYIFCEMLDRLKKSYLGGAV